MPQRPTCRSSFAEHARPGGYDELSRTYGESETDVAVRSSATAEDLPTASFAGLKLGIDRDSATLAPLFDEQDPAVLRSLEHVVEAAHRHGCKVGICGQAPSDHPKFAEFLADIGIDSMSVTSDALPAVCAILGRSMRLGRNLPP